MTHRYPSSAWFSRDVRCARHRSFGDIPCPWPECENGIPESSIYQEGFGPEPKEAEHQRLEWPFQGESTFTWNRLDTPAVLEAGEVASSAAARRWPQLVTLPTLLHHYTDVNGLMGIVREGGLWLTDAHYMNDRREIEHGVDCAQEVLSAAVDDGAYAETAGHLRGTLELLTHDVRPRVCVSSLCEDGDNLSQWRAYGSNGSRLALGFEPFVGRFRGLNHCRLHRVVYDRSVQREWLLMAVHYYHLGLRHDRTRSETWLPAIERDFSKMLYNALYELIVCFKDQAFLDEREWRFVYSENWPEDLVKDLRVPTRYRAKGRLVVPFVPMSDLVSKYDPLSRLPLREVIVGPQAEAELVARGVREFLEHEGYHDVVVRQSAVPFRPDL